MPAWWTWQVTVVVAVLAAVVLGVAAVLIFVVFWDAIRGTAAPAPLGAHSIAAAPTTIVQQARAALPTVNAAGQTNPLTLSSFSVATAVATDVAQDQPVAFQALNYAPLSTAFRYDCYRDVDDDNDCPPPVTEALKQNIATQRPATGPVESGHYPYYYDADSLLAAVHDADLYLHEAYRHVTRADVALPNGWTVRGTTDHTGAALTQAGDATRWMLWTRDLYDRHWRGTGADASRHFVFHLSPWRDYRFACIPWTKRPAGEESGGSQLYVFVDPHAAPLLIGLNRATSDLATAGRRDVVLANPVTRRFVYKGGVGPAGPRVVAAGQGGYDHGTNEWQPGKYYARVFHPTDDTHVHWQAAVDARANWVDGPAVTDVSDGAVRDWWNGAATTAAFLDLNGQQTTDLATWLTLLEGVTPLPPDQVPGGADAAPWFPDTVEFTSPP